jgi:hypothetical protein
MIKSERNKEKSFLRGWDFNLSNSLSCLCPLIGIGISADQQFITPLFAHFNNTQVVDPKAAI